MKKRIQKIKNIISNFPYWILILLSFPIWIFPTIYKFGLIFHDNLMQKIIKTDNK